jgi:hypothetical protein
LKPIRNRLLNEPSWYCGYFFREVKISNSRSAFISRNLALAYLRQGRWKDAEEPNMQVMETRKRVLGAEHPATVNSMNNLAHTWKSQNRDSEALKLMEECVELLNRVFGSTHPRSVFSTAVSY